LFCVPIFSFGQYTISGYIQEYYTNIPAANIQVKLNRTIPDTFQYTTASDIKGQYQFNAVVVGVYTVEFYRDNNKLYGFSDFIPTRDSILDTVIVYPPNTYSGGVSGVWTKDRNPYYINGIFASNLTIKGGVQLISFKTTNSGGFCVAVVGKLRIEGTQDDSVIIPKDQYFAWDLDHDVYFEYVRFDSGLFNETFNAGKNFVIKNCTVINSSLEVGMGPINNIILDSVVILNNRFFQGSIGVNGSVNYLLAKNNLSFNGGLGFHNSSAGEGVVLHNFLSGMSINNTQNYVFVNNVIGRTYFTGTKTFTFEYNNLVKDVHDAPAGIGTLVMTNSNGDSCDFYYNISEDPLLADSSLGTLLDNSPCKGAGKNGVDIGLLLTEDPNSIISHSEIDIENNLKTEPRPRGICGRGAVSASLGVMFWTCLVGQKKRKK